MKLYASLLASTLAHLAQDIQNLEQGGVDGFHIDIMDGHFVPYLAFAPSIIETVAQYTSLPLEVHLMVEEPLRWLELCAHPAVTHVVLHYESCDFEDAGLQVKSRGKKWGLAFSPQTPLHNLPSIPYDYAMVMSVPPGQGGQLFHKDSLPRIRALSQRTSVHVDGGITNLWLEPLYKAQTSTIIVGSGLWKSPCLKAAATHMQENIKKLQKSCKTPLQNISI